MNTIVNIQVLLHHILHAWTTVRKQAFCYK